jgi:hypothetical protein
MAYLPLPNKDYYLNQYKNIAQDPTLGSNQPVTMLDSPIFNRGFEKWNPTGPSSLYAQASLLGQNLGSQLTGSDKVTYGLAGLGSGAAFKQMPRNPTGIEQLKWADVFGHEMSHLGWDYKPSGERINVPGVGKEGGKLSAVLGGYGDPGDPNKYVGEEQWNYMHDLMYGPKGYSQAQHDKDLSNLDKQLGAGTITPTQYRSEGRALGDKLINLSRYLPPGEEYLKDRGLINKGDLSYTPKAFDEIAWSGLTSADKQAIGFGKNPFEDTRAAGRWHKMQRDKRATEQGIAQVAMRKRIQEEEKQRAAAKAKAAAAAAAAAASSPYSGQGAQGGGGGSNIGGGQQTSRGPVGGSVTHSQARDARGGMSGWGLSRGGLASLYG